MASKRDERPAPRRRGATDAIPESPNPIDIAMAATASGKPLPEIARRVLEEQAELLHAQRVELKLRHIGEVVRAALWAILAILAFAFFALVLAMVVRASRSDALIVERFRVPPALEARGQSGEVVATQVLDRLAQMEEQSDSIRAAKTYGNNWGDELKIDIPNTSATAEQLWRLLRGWLGKETRISGEITQTPDGLVLTTRVGSKPGQRFVSKAGNMDELTLKGAEYIYRHTQPYRYAVYVSRDPERQGEWRTVLEQLSTNPSPDERKWAFNGLNRVADSQGNLPAALHYAQRALAIDPNMYVANTNLAFALLGLGREQEATDAFARIETLSIPDEYDADLLASNRCADRALLGSLTMDVRMVEQGATCMRASPRAGYSDFGLIAQANADVLRHDPRRIGALRTSAFRWSPPVIANALATEARLRAAMLAGPSPALDAAYQAFSKASQERAAASPVDRGLLPVFDWPLQAEALAILGRTAEAQALIEKTPANCYTCVRMRGLIAKRMGDRAAAQRWFLEAAKQGPRLPQAYLDWGRLLLENGRLDSAEVKIRRAAELAPNWADPPKYWGDLLAARGERHAALAKYDAALQLAPNWKELRQARDRLARS